VVQVLVWMSAVDDGRLARIDIEAKHFCRLMIDPDEGVIVICHGAMVARNSVEGHTGHHLLVRNLSAAPLREPGWDRAHPLLVLALACSGPLGRKTW